MKKYSAERTRSFALFYVITSIFLVGFTIVFPFILRLPFSLKDFFISNIIVVIVIGLFLWTWLGTYYIIDGTTLIIRYGPLRWKLPISEIKKIHLNQSTIGGIQKATLSWKSMEIKYKKSRSIHITPQNQVEFLADLKKLNEKIEIKN